MNKIANAAFYAATAHIGQRRKYSNTPYINHPLLVGFVVSGISDDEDVIVAAILHDVVEDTEYTAEDIKNKFGDRVASLVMEVTNQFKTGNREERKLAECNRLANISTDAQSIKIADMIDNLDGIVKADPKFAVIYLKEKIRLRKVLIKAHRVLLELVDEVIVEEIKQLKMLGLYEN